MNQLERKENMDKEKKEQLKTLAMANSSIPQGTLEHYAVRVQAKVERF